jgi:hypothetical protein
LLNVGKADLMGFRDIYVQFMEEKRKKTEIAKKKNQENTLEKIRNESNTKKKEDQNKRLEKSRGTGKQKKKKRKMIECFECGGSGVGDNEVICQECGGSGLNKERVEENGLAENR